MSNATYREMLKYWASKSDAVVEMSDSESGIISVLVGRNIRVNIDVTEIK